MARPIKFGLDYFPLDVSMDDKIELIEAKYDITGFGVVIKLLQKIYANGYFINVSEDSVIVFSKRVNVDINLVNAIINDSIRHGIFDEERYKKYNILTSHGIQLRFIEATSRRKSVELIKEYLVNVDINLLNDSTYIVNDYISTQSKVKESKGDVNTSVFTYSQFYDSEIKISNSDSKYVFFVKFIFGENETKEKLSGILSIKNQITFEQFNKLLEKAKTNGMKLMDIVTRIENDKKYWKGKKSLYLTMNNWIENRFVQ